MYSNGSPSYIATSPSFPTANEPTRPSTPTNRAASMVIAANACSTVNPFAAANAASNKITRVFGTYPSNPD